MLVYMYLLYAFDAVHSFSTTEQTIRGDRSVGRDKSDLDTVGWPVGPVLPSNPRWWWSVPVEHDTTEGVRCVYMSCAV